VKPVRPTSEFYPDLFNLHKRLIAADGTALSEIARLVFDRLLSQLRREFPREDDHLLQEKAADALLEYGAAPQIANASSGAGVLGFLVLRAKSRLLTTLKRDRRRRVVEDRFARDFSGVSMGDDDNVVELPRVQGEHNVEDFVDPASAAEDTSRTEAQISDVLSGVLSDRDRRIVKLMLEGVRETSTYARVLEIEDRSLDEQRRIVKQHKDRLKLSARRRQESKLLAPRRRGRPPKRPGNGDA
jgi:hypothetical protein